jgi:hypothetical protein
MRKKLPKSPTEEELRLLAEESEIFFGCIGRGISIWTKMEGSLVEIASRLLGTDAFRTGLVLYSINFHTWLSVIDDLLSFVKHLTPLKADWGKIVNRLRGLNDTRVRLAHHTNLGELEYYRSEDGASILIPPGFDRRSKSRKHRPLNAHDIITFSHEVVLIEKELDAFLFKIVMTKKPKRPSRRKSPPPKTGRQTRQDSQ